MYVPQPYPVEKKVFVPYKVYEKQPVPIIHRYPVEKTVRVPVHVPVDQPIAILVPYPVPIGKRISVQIPIHSPSHPHLELRQIPSTTTPKPERVKFPAEDIMFEVDKSSSVQEEEKSSMLMKNSVHSPEGSPYTLQKIVPYGTRLPILNDIRSVEHQESRSGKESVQHSEQVAIITPAPVVEKCEASGMSVSVREMKSNEEAQTKNEERKAEVKDIKEETHNIVFPTERNVIEGKS